MISGHSFQNEIRNAPEVRYRAGRSRLNLGLILVLYALVVFQMSFWAVTTPSANRAFVLAFVVAHCTLPLALAGYFCSQDASIRWLPAEEVWLLEPDQRGVKPPAATSSRQISRVSVCLDLCNSMLLLVEEEALGRRSKNWLWFDRSDAPDEWKSFRRALYSPATLRLF